MTLTSNRNTLRRQERRLAKAIKQYHNNHLTVRGAARLAGLSKSTFHRRLTKLKPSKSMHMRVLSDEEEGVIVDTILSYCDKGLPLQRSDIVDAVEILISTLPKERQTKTNFKDNRQGRKFVRLFLQRHSSKICLGRPRKEQELRFRSCNAETLSTHFAALKKVIEDNNIDSSRICNLDETGSTPEKEANGRINKKRVLRSGKVRTSVVRVPTFTNVNRVTIVPAIFANGECADPLFVIKGKHIPYREIIISGPDNAHFSIEDVHDCLPSGSLVTTREKTAGVDSGIFTEWASNFVDTVKSKTLNGRKVLLIYDGYKSHIGIKALDILKNGSVIAYCLPSHTSGLLQPLDVGIFNLFKAYLRDEIAEAARSHANLEFDQFDYLHMKKRAFTKEFTAPNIVSSFKKAGVFPLDCSKVILTALPASFDDVQTTVTATELQQLLSKN